MNNQVMPNIDGIPFRCNCGCNVFTKIGEYRYRCNACRAVYQGEPEQKMKSLDERIEAWRCNQIIVDIDVEARVLEADGIITDLKSELDASKPTAIIYMGNTGFGRVPYRISLSHQTHDFEKVAKENQFKVIEKIPVNTKEAVVVWEKKSMLKITTLSGAVYYLADGGIVTGGSLELTDGRLFLPAEVGKCLFILTPERAKQNPTARVPGVGSTAVVSIEVMDE